MTTETDSITKKPVPFETQPLTALRGVGPALAEKLAKIGLRTTQDLFFHLPIRYEDRTRIVPIGSARIGSRVVVEGTVELTEIAYRRRRMLMCRLHDGTGGLTLRFFHFSQSQADKLARGARVRCFGELRPGSKGPEMVHPEYRVFAEGVEPGVEEHLTPVYPTTEGIQQGRLRNLIGQALAGLKTGRVIDWIPAGVRATTDLPPLNEALAFVHRPPPDTPVEEIFSGTHPAQQRLAFEELLGNHLSLSRLRTRARKKSALPLPGDGKQAAALLRALPFELTGAQERVAAEISKDLENDHPMMRLVQGDVGSGKTVVAALAALKSIESGQQVALMAPTELLAEQHLRSFIAWFEPLGIEVAWLASRLRAAERRNALARIASGDARLVIGTHALFQEGVEFRDLALVIVDEQHRFGVHQRLQLREKGVGGERVPHQLVMTATPIPRTLAMSVYADLDVSIIDEKPPGRQEIKTVALPDSRRDEVVERVEKALNDGAQVYWICPLVQESEQLDAQAAEQTSQQLAEALDGYRVGLVHGRMPSAEKDRAMSLFKNSELNLLVATTVVEVGVDVPNASLMIIENAERMGLAQLHQLRGRVGRGTRESSCVLLYRAPLSEFARRRIAVLRETNDGFKVAEEDLKLRGPGEVLGTRQTGLVQMRIADIVRDARLLPAVREAASQLSADYPAHVQPLIDRWVGDASRFGEV